MHLNLPVPSLAFLFASQCSSKTISDACSEKLSKTCWTEPCCNLSEVQRATLQLTACHGIHQGLVFSRDYEASSAQEHVLQLGPWAHPSLSPRAWSRCWPLASASQSLNLQLRLDQRNHGDLLWQDFLNQHRRGRVWAVPHVSWWNAVWWDTEVSTVISNLTTMWDCFPFLTSRLLTPMSHNRKYKGSDVSSAKSFCIRNETLIFFDRHRTWTSLSNTRRWAH